MNFYLTLVSAEEIQFPVLRQAFSVSGKLEKTFKMAQTLQDIYKLEDNQEFDLTFEAYNDLYLQNENDYEVWKHFYFFLWIGIEDTPVSFHDKISLHERLKEMFIKGEQLFNNKADFNFISGYTISLFPYEYGDFDEFDKQGREMLYKATKLESKNIIYELAYQGSFTTISDKNYRELKINAASKVLETFSGDGALNKYFKQILLIKEEKAYR